MRFVSEETKTARAELRTARAALEAEANRRAEGYRWWQTVPETDESNALNQRVAVAEARLPWWKRFDIDHTAG